MHVFLLVALLVSTSAYAQVQSRPTDPPLVSAAGESWYQLREPMLLGADVYYHAGAAVFFNGNVMVRSVLVARGRIELPTLRFSVVCSTN